MTEVARWLAGQPLSWSAVAVVGLLAVRTVVRNLTFVWGLRSVLRDCPDTQRAASLRAYAACVQADRRQTSGCHDSRPNNRPTNAACAGLGARYRG